MPQGRCMRTILGCCLTSAWCWAATPVPTDNLLAYFRFDETSGDILHDRSGNGHNGKIHGAVWSAANGHPYLLFQSSADHVTLDAALTSGMNGDFTIAAWVRLSASPYPDETTNWTILDCEDYDNEGLLLRIDGANAKTFFRVNQSVSTQSAFTSNQWVNGQTARVVILSQLTQVNLTVNDLHEATFA